MTDAKKWIFINLQEFVFISFYLICLFINPVLQIKHCTGRNCRNHHKNCEFRHEIWGCYRDYGICDHRPHSDNCHWKQNQDFNTCIKKSNRKLRRNKRKRKN